MDLDARPAEPVPRRSLRRAGMVLAPVIMLANVCNYAYNLVMARQLGPAAYGALGALLALVLIGSVPGVALQLVVARRTALDGRDAGPVSWSASLRRVAWLGVGL